MGNPILD